MKQFYLKNLLIGFFLLLGFQLQAADYYWVGGSGNWSEVNLHWSSTSGGAPDRSIVPGTGDDVYFDANSGLDASSVIILPTSGNAVCRNMSWVGVTAAATFRANGSGTTLQLQIYGNLELSSTVKYGMVNVRFMGSSNATYKINGAQRLSVNWYNQLLVEKTGGSLKLLDGIPANLGIGQITLESGALDLSGNTHEINRFTNGTLANTRTLNLTNATLNAAVEFVLNATNSTLLATGSTLITGVFTSNGLTFSKVEVTGTSGAASILNTIFDELLFSNPDSPAGSVKIGAGNQVGRLEFKGGGRIESGNNIIGKLILAPGKGYIFRESITVNELFQFNTPDCDALGQLTGGPSISLNLAAGAVADVQNVFLTNMVITGNGTPLTVQGADGGGNTGFNIQPRATGTTLYWVGGAGNWDDKSHWSSSSGGAGGACVPFTGDNVIFDANSGFTAVSKTVTVAGAAWCHNMTWTNVANAPVFDTGTNILEVYGNIELDPGLSISGILLSAGSEPATFTSNGASLGTLSFRIYKVPGVALTVTDDINFPDLSIVHSRGGLLMGNRNINIFALTSTGNGRIVDISNSTITVTDTWNVGAAGSTWVNNAAGSFVTSNRVFSTNGFTYPKVHITTHLNVVNITGTTIDELVFTDTSPSSLVVALNGAGNNTIGTLDVRSGGVTFMGNNTINNLLLAPSRTYYFRNTQTVNGLFRFNSPGCEGLGELRGVEGFAPTLNFGPSSTRDFDNAYVQNMTATGSGVPISVAGADAGGNTGFVFASSIAGARYWVGGAGDWNESAHWSTTSGGAGGACVPTVANDVFFDANSFTPGSKAVTINQGNAYCRNMDWTGAANAPTFVKDASFTLEIWGNMVLNSGVTSTAKVTFMGPANATLTPNNASLGALSMEIIKPGSKLTFLGDYNNVNSLILLTSGGLDLSGRTITASFVYDNTSAQPLNIDIRNATINARWHFMGANKVLQLAGSKITASAFRSNAGVYNIVDVTAATSGDISIANTTFTDLLFSNTASASQANIGANNTIGRLEFKGKGTINGSGNTIETLIFFPGKMYTFLSGSTNTITKDWFGSGTPCNLTEINSSAAGAFTVNKTTGGVELDYVRLRNISAVGNTANPQFQALEHSEDLGGNTNWSILPYDNSTPILGLGPDKTLCAGEFPYTINTEGFFASPLATFAWGDGSTNPTFVAAGPGTYTVTVSYPDGCSRSDEIVITRSEVVIDPITGTASVCVGAVTNLSTATAGGVWSSSNTAVATVNTTGEVTGVTAGTADIIYTVTNGNGCTGTVQQAVTVNALPVVNAITGTLTLNESGTTTLSSTSVGGTWSSSNTAVATVDGGGLVTGVSGGTADITYSITNASGCTASNTVTVTVDGFAPAKRMLSIVKTGDAQEPSGNGGFSISLPSGILALEDVNITYTIGGTATAPADYTALSGTAVIPAGQNSVAIPVNVVNDAQIESAETVIVTLTAGTSDNYTYTIDGAAVNATVQIADDDDVPANRLLSVNAQLNANEPSNTGTFTIALPPGILAPEAITVAYAVSGSATSGVDYEALSGTAIIAAGQNSIVIDVNSLDDQIIEQTKDIILTITGGTTVTAGNFGVDADAGAATLLQADNDYTTATRQLAITTNGLSAVETGVSRDFTISLPTGYTSSLPITVTCAISGTATNGLDYNTISTTITLPANQNSVTVPVITKNDALIEPTETVQLTIVNGVAMQGATVAFTLSPDGAAGSGTINIVDADNTFNNRKVAVTAQNATEPSANGSFTFSLPAGIFASDDVTVNYTVSGTATATTDYNPLPGTAIIPAGQNSVTVPLGVKDDLIIEANETVIVDITGANSTGIVFTDASGPVAATITDNDAATNTTVVLLTKVSDAIEGGTDGKYRISFPPGVKVSEDVVITFGLSGLATSGTDYLMLGLSGGNIVIPAGTNEVYIDVDAGNDGIVEGAEDVQLTLTSAASASYPFTIDPAGNGAVVNIIDANAAASTPLQVSAGTNAAEPAINGSFTVKLASGTSAWPVTVGYTLSGTAVSGVDYQIPGEIVIPALNNSVTVDLNVLDDQILEPLETVTFTLLSGSASDGGGNAFIFPADIVDNAITLNIADDDVTNTANRVLKVVKTTDASEPATHGVYTVSLPDGYSCSTDIDLSYAMTGTALENTDYAISTVALPAYSNSVTIPLTVTDDQIIEGLESARLTLTDGTDGNLFAYSVDPGSSTADLDITDDDNTAENRMLSVVVTTPSTIEGSATPGKFTIKLPTGVTNPTAVTVNYTIGGTATGGVDYAALSGTATIPANSGQVDVDVLTSSFNDDIIEMTETATLTITGGTDEDSNLFTVATGSETASLNIVDNDDIAVNKSLKVVKTLDAAEPGTNGAFSIGFQANTSITSSEDITVNYTIAGTATPGADYIPLSGSIVIPAGSNSVPVSVLVKDDQFLEPLNETVTLTLTGGSSASFTFVPSTTPALRSTSLNILDDENIPENKKITLTKIADASESGTIGYFRVSLPPNIYCAATIKTGYGYTGSTANLPNVTDFDFFNPGTISIPAGKNYVDFPVIANDDNFIENTETVVITPLNSFSTSGPAVGTFSWSSLTPVTVNIEDNDNTPANRHLTASLGYEGTEGAAGTAGRIRFNYALGAIPSETVTINYTVSGSAVLGTDFNGSPTAMQFNGAAQLTATGTGGTASVGVIVDDDIIEGTENVVVTINSVTSPNFTYTFDPSATARIFDNDNAPANLELAVTKTADAVESGVDGEFTISLPGTTTTATEDITVNYMIAGTATNGTDYTNLGGTVVILAGDHEVKVPVSAGIDQVLEGLETVTMTITSGSSASFAFTPNAANASATVNITDADNTPVNMALSITKENDASEPSSPGRVTFALPAGITAAQNIAVSYAVSGTATEDADYAALSGTATILAGRSSVTIPVSVIDDPVIEPLETVVISLTGGNSPGLVYTGTGSVTVNISDDESLPANLVLSISKDADATEPSTPGSFIIALPENVTATEDITISYAVSGTATNGIDYNDLSGPVVIPAGSNSISVPVAVVDDQLIENEETVTLTLSGGSSASFNFTGTGDATVSIADDDSSNPANLVLAVSTGTNAAEPVTDGSFIISLPTDILTTEDITLNYTMSGTADAGADYSPITGVITIPAGQNSVTIPVTVSDDQIIENTETVILTLNGGTSSSFTFTGTGSATVNINDDESATPANLILAISKDADGAESGSNASFTISLQPGLTAAADVTANYSVSGTATSGTDYVALAGSVMIPAGQTSVTVPVTVTDDQIIEATETLTLTLSGGSSGSLTFTGTGSATANITDDDSSPENLTLSIVKTADAAEPATNGSFSISLPAGLTGGEDITANYTVSGTATAPEDYTALSGSAVIPAGQNAVTIPLTVTNDNVPEAMETVSLTLTGGTSASLSFTASASSAMATANLTDDDKRDQVITFTPLPVKTLGDPDFTPDATGGGSGNPVTYTSSNPAVATVSGNTITIVGVGTTTITASQGGNAEYHAAADVSQVLTVLPRPNTAPTLAEIDDQQVCYTTAMQTIALTGITAGIESEQTLTFSVSSNNPDLFSSLTVTPGTAGNASLNYTINSSTGGTALITVTVKDNGGTDNGGSDAFSRTFALVAAPLPLVNIVADPGTTVSKGQTIELTASGASSYSWANAAGILEGQNSATLTVRPAQTTTYMVTGTSAAGCTSTQEITITVNEDYNLVANNVLTPNGDGKNDFFTVKNIDMYPNNEVRIFDRAGRSIYTKRSYNNEWDGTLNGSPLDEDTYYYIIDFGNGVKAKRGFISIVRKY